MAVDQLRHGNVERRVNIESVIAESAVIEQRTTELAGTDEDHNPIRSVPCEIGGNGIDKLCGVIADFGSTCTAYRTEILAHLYFPKTKRAG